MEKAIELASSNTVIIQADVMLKYLIFNHLRNLAYDSIYVKILHNCWTSCEIIQLLLYCEIHGIKKFRRKNCNV